jgi:uncharacterized protein YdeI (YjbR/CyaY-like superfamily)
LTSGGGTDGQERPARRRLHREVRVLRAADPEAPDDLLAVLKKNKKALASFEAFPPSHKREYIEWITGAKKDETRQRRLATALEWIADGKSVNWKYERK